MSDKLILVVEDDTDLRAIVEETLCTAGHAVLAVASAGEALDHIRRTDLSLILTDNQMDGESGEVLLRRVRRARPGLPVVLMTAYGSVEQAVKVIRDGAADYLVKPFTADALLNMVARFARDPAPTNDLIAEDPATLAMVRLAERVAETDATVMINGESGTGKEVFARYLHARSSRHDGPFVAINCAAIPESMLESILFGYEKGAFTGAHQARAGKFEQADGGTLLLDEITEMDVSLQAKLLRVLQEREVERLGSNQTVPVDVRLVATTNRDLREQVERGEFREDLYYRLNVFPLTVAPLRERPRDVLPLARYFLLLYAPGETVSFSSYAQAQLTQHHWAGNVRELENVVQRALILRSGAEIVAEDLVFEGAAPPAENVSSVACTNGVPQPEAKDGPGSLEEEMRNAEDLLIMEALRVENGSRQNAAQRLQISPRTLRYKLARLREERPGVVGVQ